MKAYIGRDLLKKMIFASVIGCNKVRLCRSRAVDRLDYEKMLRMTNRT